MSGLRQTRNNAHRKCAFILVVQEKTMQNQRIIKLTAVHKELVIHGKTSMRVITAKLETDFIKNTFPFKYLALISR